MAFFDDRLAMPDRYGNDHAHTVEYGIRCVKMDPIVVLTTMGMRIAKQPEVIGRLKPLGIDTVGNSSEEFSKILAADIARWGAVAKAGNIKIEQ